MLVPAAPRPSRLSATPSVFFTNRTLYTTIRFCLIFEKWAAFLRFFWLTHRTYLRIIRLFTTKKLYDYSSQVMTVRAGKMDGSNGDTWRRRESIVCVCVCVCVCVRVVFDECVQKLCSVRKVAMRLITAVGYLQCCNVIHADLKPANLILQHGRYCV